MLKKLLPDLPSRERKHLLRTRGENFEREYLMEGKPSPSARDTLRSLVGRDTALALATDCKGQDIGALPRDAWYRPLYRDHFL
jgi:hypothetical protein